VALWQRQCLAALRHVSEGTPVAAPRCAPHGALAAVTQRRRLTCFYDALLLWRVAGQKCREFWRRYLLAASVVVLLCCVASKQQLAACAGLLQPGYSGSRTQGRGVTPDT